MSSTPARFEFRAFAQSFGLVAARIREQPCHEISEQVDRYIVARGNSEANVKLRDGQLQIKCFVEKRGPLERWTPAADETFPLSSAFVTDTLLPTLNLPDRKPGGHIDSAAALLQEFVASERDLWIATVFKRRFKFEFDGCPTEIDEVLINGAAIRSVATESADADAVAAVVDRIGLSAYENVSYPRALRRVMGLDAITDSTWERGNG